MAGENSPGTDNRIVKTIATTAGLITLLVGILGLADLALGSGTLSVILTGYRTIAFSAGVIWIILGLILILIAAGRVTGRLMHGVLVVVGGITILEAIELPLSLAGLHSPVELVSVQIANGLVGHPTMPIAPIASGFFILAGIALFLLIAPPGAQKKDMLHGDAVGLLGLALTLAAFTVALSFVYEAPLLYNTPIVPIAPASVLGGLFTGIGIIAAAGWETFPLKYFSGTSTRARLLRIFVPLVIVLIIAQNIIFVAISGIIRQDAVLLSTCLIIFVAFTAWVTGRFSVGIGAALDRAEQALHRKNEDLGTLNEELTAITEELRENNDELLRNERLLRESNQRNAFLADIIDTSSQAFGVGYPDGSLGIINKAFESLTGYSAEELRKTDWAATLTPPEWREAEQKILRELEHTGGSVLYEKEYIRKDGTRVPIELLVRLVANEDGSPQYYYSFITNITNRKIAERALLQKNEDLNAINEELNALNEELNATNEELTATQEELRQNIEELGKSEQTLRENTQRLNLALEVSRMGTWDLDLVRHTAHRTLRHDQVFGYDELLPEWTYEMFIGHVVPEDRQEVNGKFQAAIGTHKDWDFECRIRRTDGIIRWIAARGKGEYDDRGQPVRMLGIVQDITERKEAEEALRKAHDELEQRVRERTRELNAALATAGAERQRLFDVLETLPSYVCLLDKDYRMPFANRYFRETFGYSDTRCCYDFLFDLKKPCDNCESYKVMKTKAPHHWYWTGPNGKDYDIYDFPFYDTDGSFFILEMGIDITERNRAEAALRTSYQLLEQRVADRTAELTRQNEDLNAAYEEIASTQEELRQNIEELGKSEQTLRESEKKFRDMFEINQAIMFVVDPSTCRIIDANTAASRFYGYSKEEFSGMAIGQLNTADPDSILKEMARAGSNQGEVLQSRHRKKNGELRDVEVFRAPIIQGGRQYLHSIVQDITDRKRNEEILTLSNRVLHTAETTHVLHDLLGNYLSILKEDTGCDSVGIRLLNPSGEIPYMAYTGFSEEFIRMESPLSIQTDQCMCINVIRGTTDPSLPFYSKGGSFYINATTKFLASVSEEDKGKSRNVCNLMGYESVALIPLHTGGRIVGLIHLADHREGMVPRERIEIIEQIAEAMSAAVVRIQAEEALRVAQEVLHTNIESLNRRDRELTETLAEKEVLLSEVHHRVKNNLAAFISLLSLEGSYEESPAGLALKKDLQNRARSMALIHETLYKTKNFSRVDMDIYLSTLVEQVVDSQNVPRTVNAVVDAEGVTLDLSQATPCGLIVNELVTNSLKYAFPPGRFAGDASGTGGTIRVSLKKEDGTYSLTIADNGVGFPENFDPKTVKSLGLKLVNFLARHQLRATIEYANDHGSVIRFRFSDTMQQKEMLAS